MQIVALLCLLSGALALTPVGDEHVELHAASKQIPELKEIPDLKVPEMKEIPKLKVPEIFPVPAASRCVVIMCCQFMIIYTALALVRTYQEFTSTPKGKVEFGLRAAAQTLTYGPMLCVLFIACRMRVEFLSDGKDQPQLWVQHCMYALTFAVLASTLLVLCVPLFTGKPLPLKLGTCDLERPVEEESESKFMFYALTSARYLILLALYGGIGGVIVGSCTYLPPGATNLIELPAPGAAVMCTMILAIIFFSTQFIIAVCRSYTEFTGFEFPKTLAMMDSAATTVEFAPMLAVLFLSARMRALQHDSQPQEWAQRCMYACTGAMCLTTIMAIAVPLALGGTPKKNEITQEVTFQVPNALFGYMLVPIRFLSLVGFYGGAVGIAYSIFAFEAPAGPDATLPVSPTVQCIVNMTCQFFFVYLILTCMHTCSEFKCCRDRVELMQLFAAVQNAKATLAFAPMLSILFITTRMYALLITDKKGAPPAWVQDGMFMSTWSLLISFLMCLGSGLVMDKVDVDEDGNVVNKFSNQYIAICMTAIRYLTMFLLYGGMVIVIVGLFVMTPETANGHGSVPFVSKAISATPVGQPPPGPALLPKF